MNSVEATSGTSTFTDTASACNDSCKTKITELLSAPTDYLKNINVNTLKVTLGFATLASLSVMVLKTRLQTKMPEFTPEETLTLLERSIIEKLLLKKKEESLFNQNLPTHLLKLITPVNGIVPDQKALLGVDQLIQSLDADLCNQLQLGEVKEALKSLDCIGGYREGKVSVYDQQHLNSFLSATNRCYSVSSRNTVQDIFEYLKHIKNPADKSSRVKSLYNALSDNPKFYHECCSLIDLFGPGTKDKILTPYTQEATQITTEEGEISSKTLNCVDMSARRGVSALYIDANALFRANTDPKAKSALVNYKESLRSQSFQQGGNVDAGFNTYDTFSLKTKVKNYKPGEEPRLDFMIKKLEEFCHSKESDFKLSKASYPYGSQTKVRQNFYINGLCTIFGDVDQFLHEDTSYADNLISILALTKTDATSRGQGILCQTGGTKEGNNREFGEITKDGEILMFNGRVAHGTGPSHADLKSMTAFRRPDEYLNFVSRSSKRMGHNIRYELEHKATAAPATKAEVTEFMNAFSEWLNKPIQEKSTFTLADARQP